LRKCFLPADDIRNRYNLIAERIGISGDTQDIMPLVGHVGGLQSPLRIDANAEMILSRYHGRKDEYNRAGIIMGRPLMAVLTEPLKGREPNKYHNMDFWSNKGGSIYSAAETLKELRMYSNFDYKSGYLVESFSEEVTGQRMVRVQASIIDGGRREIFEAQRLILAAGAFGTSRIVLRSLKKYDVSVPLLCNSHTYVPCIHYGRIGSPNTDQCHSLAQLVIYYDVTGDRQHIIVSQLYSYRSLLLFKLLNNSALSYRESLRI